jgi:hypothetical protein
MRLKLELENAHDHPRPWSLRNRHGMPLPRKPRGCHGALGHSGPADPVRVDAPTSVRRSSAERSWAPLCQRARKASRRARCFVNNGSHRGPELPKFPYWRVRKSRPFTPAAAQLIAMCLKSKIGTARFETLRQEASFEPFAKLLRTSVTNAD